MILREACPWEASRGRRLGDLGVWSLWRTGEASEAAWRTEAAVNRELFAAGRLGLADVVFCELPHRDELRRRRDSGTARAHRRFDLHERLTEPLRAWYSALDAFDPGRVRWSLPPRGELVDLPAPRPDRSSAKLFDQLVDELSRM